MNTYVPDALFPSDNPYDIPVLRSDMQAEYLDLPFVQWGTTARYREMRGTYSFYTDDETFEPIWAKPDKLLLSSCRNAIEPNFTNSSETPAALAIWNTYRKRWLARWWQENGVRILVDLFVDDPYTELNLLGVPDGWHSFATRGSMIVPEMLGVQYNLAKRISHGSSAFLFVVYGGGRELRNMYPDLKDVIWTSSLEDELDFGRGVNYIIGANHRGSRLVPSPSGWALQTEEAINGQ